MQPPRPFHINVCDALQAALVDLCHHDSHLLSAGCSERSVTHWLAIHLMKHFPDLDVDCEYNRDGFDVKKLKLSPESVQTDEVHARTVFPDIIVHKRGRKDWNVLAIEVKKSSSSADFQHDICKLEALKLHMNYSFVAHVVVGLTFADCGVQWL